MKAVLLSFLAAACGGGDARSAALGPAVTNTTSQVAKPDGFELTLGEATIVQLLDKHLEPVSRPVWKLHADGKTEVGSDRGWDRFVTVATDGALSLDGKTVAAVADGEITFVAQPELGNEVQNPIAVDRNTLAVQIDNGVVVKVELGADGGITVHHEVPRVQFRIEAADPAVMRTAFLVFGAYIAARID